MSYCGREIKQLYCRLVGNGRTVIEVFYADGKRGIMPLNILAKGFKIDREK